MEGVGQLQPDDTTNASAAGEITSSNGDLFRRPTDSAEKEILMAGLGRPLRALRRQAGNPTYEVIAQETKLSLSTLDNVFNGRHLIGSDKLVTVATYLGGEPKEWIKRWADTSTCLNDHVANRSAARPPSIPTPSDDAAGHSPAVELPPEPDTDPATTPARFAAPGLAPATDGPADQPAAQAPDEDSAVPRRRRVGLIVACVLGATAALVGLTLGLHHKSATAAQDRLVDPPVALPSTSPALAVPSAPSTNARQEPVSGQPVYKQCDPKKASRSILSEPGRDRAGEPRGMLGPGERFVVSAKTRYWKYGHVVGDPSRTGWVMSVYLCAVPGQTPGP